MFLQDNLDISKVTIQSSRGFLTVNIQMELDEVLLQQLKQDLLERIQKVNAKGVIIDLSGAPAFDQQDFVQLQKIIKMASLMGAHVILTGCHPGIASYLAESHTDWSGLRFCLHIDEAIQQMNQHVKASTPKLV